MVKPIPVFAFVFAAYAATCSAPAPVSERRRKKIDVAADESSQASNPAQALVVPIWLTLFQRGADISVKVGVFGGSRGARLDLASTRERQRGEGEALWLSDLMSETAEVLGGTVVKSGRPQIKIGRKVRFEYDNVLDWTLRSGARKADALGDAPSAALLERLPK